MDFLFLSSHSLKPILMPALWLDFSVESNYKTKQKNSVSCVLGGQYRLKTKFVVKAPKSSMTAYTAFEQNSTVRKVSYSIEKP